MSPPRGRSANFAIDAAYKERAFYRERGSEENAIDVEESSRRVSGPASFVAKKATDAEENLMIDNCKTNCSDGETSR